MKIDLIKLPLVLMSLLCLLPASTLAQTNPVIEELLDFGEYALQERWGSTARIVLQATIEQAPRNERAARLFTEARTLAEKQQVGASTLRISLLRAALVAHERKMFRATKIILIELQRLEPNDKNIQNLLAEVNQAISQGSATYYSPRRLPSPPVNTPQSSAQVSDTEASDKIKPESSGMPTNALPQTQAQEPTLSTSSDQSKTTTYEQAVVDKQLHTPTIPKPVPAHGTPDVLPLKLRSEYEESLADSPNSQLTHSRTPLERPEATVPKLYSPRTPSSKQSSIPASAPHASPPPSATSVPPPSQVSPIPKASSSAQNTLQTLRNPQDYPGYEHPYVIPVYQQTQVERAEVEILTQWRDSVTVENVNERGAQSTIKIAGKTHKIGDIVLPEYYLFWRGLNPETRTLYFLDRRGNVFRKQY